MDELDEPLLNDVLVEWYRPRFPGFDRTCFGRELHRAHFAAVLDVGSAKLRDFSRPRTRVCAKPGYPLHCPLEGRVWHSDLAGRAKDCRRLLGRERLRFPEVYLFWLRHAYILEWVAGDQPFLNGPPEHGAGRRSSDVYPSPRT